MKNTNTIKKFQFFDDEKELKGNYELGGAITKAKFSLNEITPIQMENKNGFCFIIGSVAHLGAENKGGPEISMIKVYKNQVIEEYELFTTRIFHFKIVTLQDHHYIIAYGCDFSEPDKQYLTSLKIFDISRCLNKLQPEQPVLLQTINVMEDGSNLIIPKASISYASANSIQNSNCLNVNDTLSSVAIAVGGGMLIYIAAKPNLIEPTFTSFKYLPRIITEDDSTDITNLFFCKMEQYPFLYFTTEKNIYYYRIDDKKEEGFCLNAESGASPNCFDIKPTENKLLIATSTDGFIVQYEHFDKGASWFFDGKKKYIAYFKNYIAFVADEDKVSNLGIYDTTNKFFAYYNNNMNKIINVSYDKESIYVLMESEGGMDKNILILKEKDNKEKFDTFYKKSFYDTAYEYAKSLKYDKKTLSEISIRHANFLYTKGDYGKAIEQFILTINYLDPSYVIIKFLDGAKLDYLISYLEALLKDEQMKKSCSGDEMKNYTALLLNCYIKQKKINKLQTFVEEKNLNEQLIDVATAIEVCKDSKHYKLALSIAEKSNLTDSYIQILLDMKDSKDIKETKGSYKEALEYLNKEKDIGKKFQMFVRYGEKFLEKNPFETMNAILPLIETIIKIKNNTTMIDISKEEKEAVSKIQYETIMQIFHSKETELGLLIDGILKADPNCPASIIHRKIELLYDQYLKEDKKGKSLDDDIISIIKNDQYYNKIDKNYLLMLFSTQEFNKGIIELSDKMNLKQELFQIYLDTFNYSKIMAFCNKHGAEDVNLYIQALTYFINIYMEGMKGLIETNIKTILKKIIENESLSPILLFEVLGKTKNLKYYLIQDFVLDYLKKQQKVVDEDKKCCEDNYKKIEKLNNEIKELNQKSKLFNMVKCSVCNQQLYTPATYFFCNHAFHSICLNAELRDDMRDVECPLCKNKAIQFAQRIKQSEEKANDHNTFFTDLPGKKKKNDMIAQYLGKGIFNMDK